MNDSLTSGGGFVVFATTEIDLEIVALRHLPQPAELTPTPADVVRLALALEAEYQRGYADAVRFVEAEAAQRDAARAAGRGE